MSKTTRREFLKLGLAAAGGALAGSAVEIPLFSNQNSSMQTALNNANNQLTNAKNQLATLTGFLSLSVGEQALVEAIVETIIPSDGTGPGAKEAGVIYFIDRQLAGDYGQSANMFMQAPHLPPNIPAGSFTVPVSMGWVNAPAPAGGGGTVTSVPPYTLGTASPRVGSGINYQYSMNLREFWRVGLLALSGDKKHSYANLAYGGNFETLSSSNQSQVLLDLWNGAPTTKYQSADDLTGFSNIVPSDFAYEVTFMTWAGFLMDPIHGGNQNMVGWEYVGFNGVNLGNAYGEGLSQKTLMVASSPTRLKPASLAQYQKTASGGA